MASIEQLNIFLLYWVFITNSVGLLSSVLMFVVFFGPNLRKLSVSVYFRALAMSDLIMNILIIWQHFMYLYSQSAQLVSDLGCKSVSYLNYVVSRLSTWYLVAAGLDRLVNIVYPTKLSFVRNPRFTVLISLLVLIYQMTFYIDILIVSRLVNTTIYSNDSNDTLIITSISCELDSGQLAISVADFINGTILPSAIVITSTTATIVGVYKSHSRVRTFSKGQSVEKRLTRDLKFGVSMSVLNAVFLLFRIPDTFSFVVNVSPDINIIDESFQNLYVFLYQTLMSLFYATEFSIQLASNSVVRNECRVLFSKACRFFQLT